MLYLHKQNIKIMLTFISCAKTMTARSKVKVPSTSIPQFENIAKENAIAMSELNTEELAKALHINSKLASENKLRYMDFFSENNNGLPAILSYTGMVFKRISPESFTADDFNYAQSHLFITSFLYGLLRPLDSIKNYRLEGNIKLHIHNGKSMFDFWKPVLTDYFIDEIKKQGGALINLASGEMKDLFDWERLKKNVEIITPEFYTIKNGKPTTVVIYAKMCRGEMTRFIIKNRIENPEQLKSFEWEGFCFKPEMSTDKKMVFCME